MQLVRLLLHTGFVLVLADMKCPGSQAALFHTGMKVYATVGVPCEAVSEEIVARVNGQHRTWSDPHNNGTYTRSRADGALSFSRLTADKQYTDDMIFTLS